MKNVLIGIQARSKSVRLPNKAMKIIRGSTIIDHVIWRCRSAQNYINRYSERRQIYSNLAVLIPVGDPLKEHLKGRVDIIEGPEEDVIARYKVAIDNYKPDYLVRITADCPLMLPWLIGKTINVLIYNDYDFVTNAHPQLRTFADGHDVEACNIKLFNWLNEFSSEREHVFKILYDNVYPEWKIGHVFNHTDMSSVKLSVDTEKDYELVRKQMESMVDKKRKWESLYGEGTAYKF